MDESFDREKIIDCMFDPITSEILAKLEDGKKECSVLSQEFSMSESDILQRLDYLIECEFIFKTSENQKYFISANNEKLSSLLENNDTFDGAINGLEKMDSYLNWSSLISNFINCNNYYPIIPKIIQIVDIVEKMNLLSVFGSGPIAPAT